MPNPVSMRSRAEAAIGARTEANKASRPRSIAARAPALATRKGRANLPVCSDDDLVGPEAWVLRSSVAVVAVVAVVGATGASGERASVPLTISASVFGRLAAVVLDGFLLAAPLTCGLVLELASGATVDDPFEVEASGVVPSRMSVIEGLFLRVVVGFVETGPSPGPFTFDPSGPSKDTSISVAGTVSGERRIVVVVAPRFVTATFESASVGVVGALARSEESLLALVPVTPAVVVVVVVFASREAFTDVEAALALEALETVDALPGRCGVGVPDAAAGSTEMLALFVVGEVVMEVAVAPGVALAGVALAGVA